MRSVIESDHAGFELKTTLAKFLRELGNDVVDVGTSSTDPVDYPDFGVGASVAANKLHGIRAGCATIAIGASGSGAR